MENLRCEWFKERYACQTQYSRNPMIAWILVRSMVRELELLGADRLNIYGNGSFFTVIPMVNPWREKQANGGTSSPVSGFDCLEYAKFGHPPDLVAEWAGMTAGNPNLILKDKTGLGVAAGPNVFRFKLVPGRSVLGMPNVVPIPERFLGPSSEHPKGIAVGQS
jgi:hypothetical protein